MSSCAWSYGMLSEKNVWSVKFQEQSFRFFNQTRNPTLENFAMAHFNVACNSKGDKSTQFIYPFCGKILLNWIPLRFSQSQGRIKIGDRMSQSGARIQMLSHQLSRPCETLLCSPEILWHNPRSCYFSLSFHFLYNIGKKNIIIAYKKSSCFSTYIPSVDFWSQISKIHKVDPPPKFRI